MKGHLIFLFMLLPVFGWENLYAQQEGQAAIDSIRKELASGSYHDKDDTNKVDLINKLAYFYLSVDPGEGIKYGQQALELATKLDWKKGIAQAKNALGKNYMRKSDNPKALEYYQGALELYKEIGFKKGIATVTSNIGLLYYSQGDIITALAYYSEALKIHEAIENKEGIGIACDNIGDIYKNQGNYQKALEYYLYALKMFRETGKKVGVALVTGDIGIVYRYQKNYTMAIGSIRQTIKMDEELGDRLGVAWGLTNTGIVYLSVFRDTSATSIQDIDSSGFVVEKYMPLKGGKAAMLDKAIDYLQAGLTKGKEILADDIMQACYQNLAECYRLKGDYKQAMEYYKEYAIIKDSVFSKANSEKMVQIEYESTRLSDSLKTSEAKKIADLKLRHERNYTYLGIAGIALLLGFSFFIIKERGKSEKLLLNILPSKVAAELKANGVTKARLFDNVTVLFTDFVNFTKAGEQMSPQQLIDELHACFKAFDEITEKYNIEKIKTIGDAYLAVAGLPVADPGHAENIIMAAIEINKFMNERLIQVGGDSNRSTFEIRIGVHSGSVVAGIVGVKKFAYDIWGDAVNIAARMEQNSESGKINISQTTYELVKDKLDCIYKGAIETKNKGMVSMYFVNVPGI